MNEAVPASSDGSPVGPARRLLRAAWVLVRAVLALLALFFAWTSALWKSPVLAVWFLAVSLALAVAPRAGNLRAARRALIAVILVAAVAIGLGWRVPFRDVETRMEALHTASLARPPALKTFDRLAIWSGNVAMGLGGYAIGMPEVAWETLRMAWPGPAEHVVASDFAMKSRRVRAVVAGFARSLPPGGGPPRTSIAHVAWSRNYAALGYSEARVALAVNCPFVVEMKAARDGDAWKIDCRGSCDVAYGSMPDMAPIIRVGGKTLRISEAMFAALRREGWLHPYRATYVWTVRSDDPRLR